MEVINFDIAFILEKIRLSDSNLYMSLLEDEKSNRYRDIQRFQD